MKKENVTSVKYVKNHLLLHAISALIAIYIQGKMCMSVAYAVRYLVFQVTYTDITKYIMGKNHTYVMNVVKALVQKEVLRHI